jgi:SAM-dependent methyltransferase
MSLTGEGRAHRRLVRRNAEAWEDWGRIDPLWAILTEPSYQKGRWDLAEFLATGERAVSAVLETARQWKVPLRWRQALDFGCGVGRLTRPLAARSGSALGLDVSSSMIARASELNSQIANLRFELHTDPDLARFADGSFDVVVSLFVLQHIPDVAAIERYVGELVRVLATGGLAVIQLPFDKPAPAARSLRSRLALRRRATGALRRLGVPAAFLYRHLRWQPDMPMNAVPQAHVKQLIAAAGGELLHVDSDTDFGGVRHAYYYISKQ